MLLQAKFSLLYLMHFRLKRSFLKKNRLNALKSISYVTAMTHDLLLNSLLCRGVWVGVYLF